MRIGNWLGGSVIWAWAATMSMAAGAGTAEHVTTVPLGGSLDGQSGDHHYGVYVPTRFGGELKVTTTEGQVVDLKGPNGHAQGQRPGHRLRSAGVVYLQDRGREEAVLGGNQLRSSGVRARRSPGTSITGRPRPTRFTNRGPGVMPGSTR